MFDRSLSAVWMDHRIADQLGEGHEWPAPKTEESFSPTDVQGLCNNVLRHPLDTEMEIFVYFSLKAYLRA